MKKYRHFTLEYKQSIIQEIESGSRSKAAIAREENLASSMLDRWQQQYRSGTMVNHPSARERELMKENDWYKKKVAEQAREIDLLKKIDEYSRHMRKSNGCIVTGRNAAVLRKDVQS